MADTNPLSYFTTEALIGELQDRNDTTIIVLYHRDKVATSKLVCQISGLYVEATGLAQLIPQFVEDALGEAITDEDPD